MPRKFYHFTAKEYVPSILATGLTKGDVPTGLTTGMNAVWLTTMSNPTGNGLMAEHVLTDEEGSSTAAARKAATAGAN